MGCGVMEKILWWTSPPEICGKSRSTRHWSGSTWAAMAWGRGSCTTAEAGCRSARPRGQPWVRHRAADRHRRRRRLAVTSSSASRLSPGAGVTPTRAATSGPTSSSPATTRCSSAGSRTSPSTCTSPTAWPNCGTPRGIWGLDTFETEDALKKEHGKDVRVACIGPAGEKVALIASVMNNKGRAAGRSGLGAVMGSKKLKAVAVQGDLRPPTASPAELLRDMRKRHVAALAGHSAQLHAEGTPGIYDICCRIDEPPPRTGPASPNSTPPTTRTAGEPTSSPSRCAGTPAGAAPSPAEAS